MKQHWLKLCTLLSVVAGLTALPMTARAAGGETHAPLHHAIHELEAAVVFMHAAPHDFGGHREAAIRDSEAAIAQLRVCLDVMHVGAVRIPAWENAERHPMRRAVIALEEARNHLQRAAHDFHGHRELALKLCDAALRQLHEALAHEVVVVPRPAPAVVRVEVAETQAPLHHAIHELELAVVFMRAEPHNFGGHKEAAIRDSEAAIGQLRECLEAVHAGSIRYPAWENPERHPMRRAMIALEEARHHLEHASHDYYGHREQALKLSDAAIRQLREALEHERR